MKMRPTSNQRCCNMTFLLNITTWLVVSVYGTQAFNTLGLASKYLAHQSNYPVSNGPRYTLNLERDLYAPYDDDNLNVDNTIGLTDENSMKPNKISDDSDVYEERRDVTKQDTGRQETENEDMGFRSPMRSRIPNYPKPADSGIHRSFRRSPANMASGELDKYLSAFYLIKTPYGYVLGRQNPTMSATSIARRSVRASNSQKRSDGGF